MTTTTAVLDMESGLEVVPQEALRVRDAKAWDKYYDGVREEHLPEVDHRDHGIEVAPAQYDSEKIVYGSRATVPEKASWWKQRKVVLLGGIALLVVVVALGAGLGLGLRKKNGSSSSPDSIGDSNSGAGTSTSKDSPCAESFCSQTLAATAWPRTIAAGNNSDAVSLGIAAVILARINSDGILQHRSITDQTFDPRWTDLDDGKTFSGRPAVAVWVPPLQDARVDLFAVDADKGSLLQTYEQNGQRSAWDEIAPAVSDKVTACRMGGESLNRADTWYTTKKNIVGHYSSTEGNSSAGPYGFTPDDLLEIEAIPTTGVAPGITCQEGDIQHNLVVYDPDDRTVSHRQWNVPNSAWSEPTVLSSEQKFIDEPVLVDVSPERFDFFGVGEDNNLYHFNWLGGTLSELELVGRDVASAPSAVSVSDGRIDVVVVGTDGQLKHRSLLGSTWSGDWDDLGVVATGAPLLVSLGGKIYVFVVVDGDVSYAIVSGEDVATKWKIKDSLTRLS